MKWARAILTPRRSGAGSVGGGAGVPNLGRRHQQQDQRSRWKDSVIVKIHSGRPGREVTAVGRRLKPSFLRREERVMFKTFWKDESGLELTEYAAAAALVAIGAVVAFQTLGASIGSRIDTLAGYLK